MDDQEFYRLIVDPKVRENRYTEMVRAYFDRVTDTYREKWGDSFHFGIFSGSESLVEALLTVERMIADEGGFRPGMRVLDIGCGVGGPALTIAEYTGAHVTGVNIVERQVEIARERAAERGLADRTRFEVADGMRMPFPDGAFDAVYIFEAGCHMPDKAAFYVECARVLRPGGVFLGTEWMRREGLSAQEETRYIEPICRCFAVPHMVTLVELKEYVTAAGLGVELLEDVSVRGDILRNWELLDDKTIEGIRGLAPDAIPPTLRMLTDGGIAIAEAARAGAFVIGHWLARKPPTAAG